MVSMARYPCINVLERYLQHFNKLTEFGELVVAWIVEILLPVFTWNKSGAGRVLFYSIRESLCGHEWSAPGLGSGAYTICNIYK